MPCCISNPTFSACPAQSQVVLHLCPEGKVQPGICDPAGNKMQHICCSESRHIRKECMCSNWINWTFERSTSQSNGRKDCGSKKRSIKKSVVYVVYVVYSHAWYIKLYRLFPLRSALLCLLTTCKGGAWVSEQANSSVLEFYPPWRYMMNCHIQHAGLVGVAHTRKFKFSLDVHWWSFGSWLCIIINSYIFKIISKPILCSWNGTWISEIYMGWTMDNKPHTICGFLTVIWVTFCKVARVAWWMGAYAAPTPKRHYAFSNSRAILKLDLGVFQWNQGSTSSSGNCQGLQGWKRQSTVPRNQKPTFNRATCWSY